jgi:hypothetical protein
VDKFEIRVEGLRKLDRLELEERLRTLATEGHDSSQLVRFEESGTRDGEFGEAITFVVIGGVLVLKALIAYWVTRDRHDRFKESLEITKPDGSRMKYRLDFKIDRNVPLDEQVVHHLSRISDLPIAELTGIRPRPN